MAKSRRRIFPPRAIIFDRSDQRRFVDAVEQIVAVKDEMNALAAKMAVAAEEIHQSQQKRHEAAKKANETRKRRQVAAAETVSIIDDAGHVHQVSTADELDGLVEVNPELAADLADGRGEGGTNGRHPQE